MEYFFSQNQCLSVTDILYPFHVVSLDTSQKLGHCGKKQKFCFIFHGMMQESPDQLRDKG